MWTSLCLLLVVTSLSSVHRTCSDFTSGDPNGVIVHLIDWRYDDIAKECQHFLGPKGFAAVQVSPVNENLVLQRSPQWYDKLLKQLPWYGQITDKIPWYNTVNTIRPWYERYEPLSYKIASRAGNETEFADMVETCTKAGVKIYVDAVLNHMTRSFFNETLGAAGSVANTVDMVYPDVPYSTEDFNQPTCTIQNYQNATEMRNCEMNGMHDLNQTSSCVRDKMRNYLNKLLSIGVAGFRINYAALMWPEDLKKLFTRLDFLNDLKGFAYEQGAFLIYDVMQSEQDAIKPSEYYSLSGLVTDYNYAYEIANVFLRKTPLNNLKNFGEDATQFVKRDKSIVFVDNYYTQRNNGPATPIVLTYKYSKLYKMAVAFMLAWPHGQPLLTSSYFTNDDYQGPPSSSKEEILHVGYADNGCVSGWICEHRWRAVYGMVTFRNTVADESVTNWWDNGSNQIAFSRGNKGFIVINADTVDIKQDFETGLPAGTYCDVISGEVKDNQCTGTSVTVDNNGKATVTLAADTDTGVLAVHIGEKLN